MTAKERREILRSLSSDDRRAIRRMPTLGDLFGGTLTIAAGLLVALILVAYVVLVVSACATIACLLGAEIGMPASYWFGLAVAGGAVLLLIKTIAKAFE